MLESPEESDKDSQNKINTIIAEKKSKSNGALKKLNIIPIKLNLIPENLSRKKTNLDSLSKRKDSNGEEISKSNKKHRVNFIDQISSGKNFAQIIYIDDQASPRDSKKNAEIYEKLLRKKDVEKNKQNVDGKKDEEIYKIKRPKRSKINAIRKVETVDEKCRCNIF